MRAKAIPIAVCALLAAAPAGGHPHAFVDAALHLVVADGRLTRIEVTWRYDAFTSLFLLEERGLDPDGDGVLSDDERAILRGFDVTDWPEDFAGDLFVESDGRSVALGDPTATGIDLIGGEIVASHVRPVPDVPVDDVVVRNFDPTYYIAYSLAGGVSASEGCAADVVPFDRAAADAEVQRELNTIPEDMFEIMQVGHLYADTIRLSCAASS